MQEKSKKLKNIFTIVFLLIIISIICIIVKVINTESNLSNLKNGIIDIKIEEYTINNDGDKVKRKEKKNILPGDQIIKISEISCEKGSMDCYVRAKIDIIPKNENMFKDFNLHIDESKWFHCNNNGYWYYKEILTDESEKAILNIEVNIPEEYNNYALNEFEIIVNVEAVQAKKITPNFSNESTEPWFGITKQDIQEFIYSENIK